MRSSLRNGSLSFHFNYVFCSSVNADKFARGGFFRSLSHFLLRFYFLFELFLLTLSFWLGADCSLHYLLCAFCARFKLVHWHFRRVHLLNDDLARTVADKRGDNLIDWLNIKNKLFCIISNVKICFASVTLYSDVCALNMLFLYARDTLINTFGRSL